MKNANCDSCKDAKFGVAYIDPESGILCGKIDTDMELPKGKKYLLQKYVQNVVQQNGRQ